jgi:hypothetical protein
MQRKEHGENDHSKVVQKRDKERLPENTRKYKRRNTVKKSMKQMKSTNPGVMRGGQPEFADAPINSNGEYAPSDKLHQQSAGSQRRGANAYADYPDVSTSDDAESTGSTGAGSKKGSR